MCAYNAQQLTVCNYGAQQPTVCEYDDRTGSSGNLHEQLPDTQQDTLRPQASTSPIAHCHTPSLDPIT